MNTTLLLVALVAVEGDVSTQDDTVVSDPPVLSTWSVTDKPADVPFDETQAPAAAAPAPAAQAAAAPGAAPAEGTANAEAAAAPAEAPAPPAPAQAQARAPAPVVKKSKETSAKAAPAPTAEVKEVVRVEKVEKLGYNRIGVVVDAGVPDGLGASVSFRPFQMLRLHGGAIGNGVSTGFRGGVTLAPLNWVFRPTLSVEAGRYFDGDASWLLGDAGDPTLKTLLSSVAYDFGNAHLGLELGGDNFGFFLRGGLSYIDLKVTNLAAAIPAPAGTFTGAPGHLRAVLPSLKLGLHIHFI